MKFKEYLKAINELAQEYPESLNMKVIYSHDDEGNEYQKINNYPCLIQIQDLTQNRFLEVIKFQGQESINIKDYNAILIN
jgi:hypothetical protein